MDQCINIFIKIFAQISDSVRNFNEFAVVAIAVD